MPRKRKSVESTEIPTATFASAEPGAATAVAEPPAVPAAEPNVNGPTHAEGVSQRKWQPAPDPFGIVKDNLAGVRLFESRQDRRVAIRFDDKPSQAVIDRMKEAGYRWKAADKIWAHPVYPDSAMTTRIDAEYLYQEVCQMIRAEKGIAKEQGSGVPF
jgi:hypothetical protein